MRPHVLDQLERNRTRSRSRDSDSAASERRGKPSSRRGPKHRPTYRVWEYATWRARMRAWCNQIKATLLREASDPAQPQTYLVIQSPACPIDSQSTWLSWWEGEAIPRPSHIAAAEKLVPRSSELLELAETRTHLSRQFLALDILNTKFRVTGRPSDHRRAQARRLLTGLNDAWASFLDVQDPPSTSRYNVVNQLGHSAAELLAGYVVPADQLPRNVDLGENPVRWLLPPEAVLEHCWLEPVSILRFLAMLAGSDCLKHPKLVELWAVDFASAALTVRTLIETGGRYPTPFTLLRMGFTAPMYMLATDAFIAPRYQLDQANTLDVARLVYGDQAEKALANLHLARDTYYDVFASLGISETALRALNGTHWEKTWDGAFSAARARL